jgi:hypothetical protein
VNKKVVIVGVGALGSHVTLLLRNEAQLKVVDFDRIEHKNVLAQFHSKPNVGKNKAQALQQTLNFLYGVKVDAVPHKLIVDNLSLLTGVDLIIDCVDNGATRRLIQEHVRSIVQVGDLTFAKGTLAGPHPACLHGALAPGGDFGQVLWDEDFKVDDEAGAGQATCEGGEHLPFINVVSSYIALAAQRYLKDGTKHGFQIHGVGATRVR